MKIQRNLSIVRIVLAGLIVVLLVFPFHTIGVNFEKYLINGQLIVDSKYFIAGFLFIGNAFIDVVNYYLMKKSNADDTNKFLDDVTDKILISTSLIILSSLGFITPLIPIVIIVRDVIVNAIETKTNKGSNSLRNARIEKYKNFALILGIILVLFYNLPFELWNIRVADFVLSIASVLSVITGFEYYRNNKDLFFKKRQN